ncbi:MAG: hypothetical protein Q4C30_08505 [Bacteroidia bacterium]|nr:hypothetical protein [Bacteroidia bacterium]
MIKMLGNTGFTACMATGNIKNYSIWVTIFGITAFPMTYIAYKCGMPVEYAYYSYIFAYAMVEVVRLILMKRMIGFPPMRFVKEVFVTAFVVTSIAVVLPWLVHTSYEEGIYRFVIVSLASIVSSLLSIAFVGLNKQERQSVLHMLFKFIKRKK